MRRICSGRVAGFIALLAGVITMFCLHLAVGTAWGASRDQQHDIILETGTFSYRIDSAGINVAFIDRASGRDYLKKDAAGQDSVCALAVKNGKTLCPTRVTFNKSILKLDFSGGITATVAVTIRDDRLVLQVQNVSGQPDSLTFVNVVLSLDAKPNEPFAACCLSLNPHTHVHQLPALHSKLWATCYSRFELKNAKAAMIGVPQKSILTAIRDTMKTDAVDIPLSTKGGAWAMDSQDGYGSYLMNFGTINEDNVDQVIKLCKMLGFTQLDIRGLDTLDPTGKRPFHFLYGSYELNKKNFPEGWKSFKRMVARLKANGISVILHHYSAFISRDSNLVTPIPHPDLDVISTFTLAQPIDEKATEIVVKESTRDVSTDQGYVHVGNRTIRIGNEIIEFTDVTREAPFKFTGCTRGFHGTHMAAHTAGSQVGFLKTFWRTMYVARPDSKLYYDMARQAAQIVNECGLDGVYLDAIEGMKYMWGEENYWYYGGQFVFELMKNVKRPIGLEYAGMTHHWWHYRSRYQAWDMVNRGYKRFIDIHMTSMKEGVEHQHGFWNGSIADIEKYGSMKGSGLYLPFQMGWWSFASWFSAKLDIMYDDDIEYLCCKLLANNAGLSTTGTLDDNMFAQRPNIPKFMEIVRLYEELRHANYFDESILAQLRVPGKEFTLFKQQDGRWNFKPVVFQKHTGRIHSVECPSHRWNVENTLDTQVPKLRIEALYATGEYFDSKRIDLVNCDTCKTMIPDKTAPGTSLSLKTTKEKVPATVEPAMELVAKNDGKSRKDASWCSLIRTFDEPLNLDNRQAIGVWVCGDGNGQVIDFRLATEAGFAEFRSSHLIKIDFTGWKYFVLVESDSSAMSDYYWPKSFGYYVYNHHSGRADYHKIKEFQLWCNNVPASRECRVLIGPVAAIPILPAKLQNPILRINGQDTLFPVTMTPGMYLEMKSKDDCRLYSWMGKELQKVTPVGSLAPLKKGNNLLSFTCEKEEWDQMRFRVTVRTEGKPLEQKTSVR